jgi:hypothetical protein
VGDDVCALRFGRDAVAAEVERRRHTARRPTHSPP